MKKSEAKKLLKKEILSVLNEDYQLNEADPQAYDDIADTLRVNIPDSYLQNQIDTIIELIQSTLYKLKNLN